MKFGEKFIASGKAYRPFDNSQDSYIVNIYINPYEIEIEENLPFGARGYISPNLDLYFEGYDHPYRSRVPHQAILRLIYKENPNLFPEDYIEGFMQYEFKSNPIKYGTLIQRDGKTNNLYVGESIAMSGGLEIPKIATFMRKAQKAHPEWKFLFKHIHSAASKENDFGHANANWGRLGIVDESFFGADKAEGVIVQVYKNPTPYEIRDNVCDSARAYIDKEGNLYMEGYEEKKQQSRAMHQALLSIIYSVDSSIFPYDYVTGYYKSNRPDYGVTVQRKGNSNEIYIGESELRMGEEKAKLIALCHNKNPSWQFILNGINKVEGFLDFSGDLINMDDFDSEKDFEESKKFEEKIIDVTSQVIDNPHLLHNFLLYSIDWKAVYFVPTEDYQLTKDHYTMLPSDDAGINEDQEVVIRRRGQIFLQIPWSKIKEIYIAYANPIDVIPPKLPTQQFDLFPESRKRKLYEAFTNTSNKEWTRKEFDEHTKEWNFFGDEFGGVGVKIQEDGSNKIVSYFGSPRSIALGFKQLMKERKSTWGKKQEGQALENRGFINPPIFVMKLLERYIPYIASLTGNLYFYESTIAELEEKGVEIPSLVKKWIAVERGKR